MRYPHSTCPAPRLARPREGDRGRRVRYRSAPGSGAGELSDDTESRADLGQGWATAKTLAEALPYIQTYDRSTVVIKYGGHAMGEGQVAKLSPAAAVLLNM